VARRCSSPGRSAGTPAAQALRNVVAVLAQVGAAPQHIVRMTWYVVDKAEYLACNGPRGRAYRAVIGPHYPAMTAIEVKGLVEGGARVEIEATAVVPDPIGRAEAAGR
jgi:enamine deaminase RidA (YjgF/YER057c/UK114 family)